MTEAQEIVRCTSCRMDHHVDRFEVDRLGRRRKTCLSCKEKRKIVVDRNKCPHGRLRNNCKECGGTSICEHGRRRQRCRDCGGVSICEHGRNREVCTDCNGTQICEHGCRRYVCKECDGHGLCEHKRPRSKCKECGGASVCEHGRQRSHCKECGGASICEHGRQRNYCKECVGASICVHGRHRNYCKECGGASICEHDRQRKRCKECGGASICEHDRRRDHCSICDPVGYLRGIVTGRVRSALKSDKVASSIEYLGCSVETLRGHLEHQFTLACNEGMSWENHGNGAGKWNIDHIVPIKYPGKDGSKPTLEEVAERLHWKNCQPMWSLENITKGNRFIGRRAERDQKQSPGVALTDADIDEILAEL